MLLLLVPAAYGLSGGLAGAFGAASSPPPSGNVILRVGMVNEPDSLNPFIGGSTTAYLLYHLNYDLLTGYRAADVAPAPELATSWTHTADGKTWTFKLREGVTWQDGQPFTAADVAFTYNTIIKDKIDAFANYTGFIDDVRAVDDHTGAVRLQPAQGEHARHVDPHPAEAHLELALDRPDDAFVQNPTPIVGTGPFQVVEWKHSRYVRLTANPTYWRGKPKVDEVVISFYENPDVMSQDLQSGALDAAWGLPPAAFGKLSSVKAACSLSRTW